MTTILLKFREKSNKNTDRQNPFLQSPLTTSGDNYIRGNYATPWAIALKSPEMVTASPKETVQEGRSRMKQRQHLRVDCHKTMLKCMKHYIAFNC